MQTIGFIERKEKKWDVLSCYYSTACVQEDFRLSIQALAYGVRLIYTCIFLFFFKFVLSMCECNKKCIQGVSFDSSRKKVGKMREGGRENMRIRIPIPIYVYVHKSHACMRVRVHVRVWTVVIHSQINVPRFFVFYGVGDKSPPSSDSVNWSKGVGGARGLGVSLETIYLGRIFIGYVENASFSDRSAINIIDLSIKSDRSRIHYRIDSRRYIYTRML